MKTPPSSQYVSQPTVASIVNNEINQESNNICTSSITTNDEQLISKVELISKEKIENIKTDDELKRPITSKLKVTESPKKKQNQENKKNSEKPTNLQTKESSKIEELKVPDQNIPQTIPTIKKSSISITKINPTDKKKEVEPLKEPKELENNLIHESNPVPLVEPEEKMTENSNTNSCDYFNFSLSDDSNAAPPSSDIKTNQNSPQLNSSSSFSILDFDEKEKIKDNLFRLSFTSTSSPERPATPLKSIYTENSSSEEVKFSKLTKPFDERLTEVKKPVNPNRDNKINDENMVLIIDSPPNIDKKLELKQRPKMIHNSPKVPKQTISMLIQDSKEKDKNSQTIRQIIESKLKTDTDNKKQIINFTMNDTNLVKNVNLNEAKSSKTKDNKKQIINSTINDTNQAKNVNLDEAKSSKTKENQVGQKSKQSGLNFKRKRDYFDDFLENIKDEEDTWDNFDSMTSAQPNSLNQVSYFDYNIFSSEKPMTSSKHISKELHKKSSKEDDNYKRNRKLK